MVEVDHGNVLRHPKSNLAQDVQGSAGLEVGADQDGVQLRIPARQPGDGVRPAVRCEVTLGNKLRRAVR